LLITRRASSTVSKKAQELHVDVAALKSTLGTLAATTNEVAQEGNSVTITHTQTSSIGRTDVIMGNSEHVQSGKLTRSARGDVDWTPYYYIIGAVLPALVIIIGLLAK